MKLRDRLYKSLPIPMQNAAVSLQGYSFRVHRSKSEVIRKHLDFLLASQFWTTEEFQSYQLERLKALLTSSASSIPYYRDLFAQLRFKTLIKELADIEQLPILEKTTLRGSEDLFLHSSAQKSKLYHGFTSGTTGTPLNWYESQVSFSQRQAFIARLRTWADLSQVLYPKRAQFTGRDVVPPSQKNQKVYWRHNLPGRALLLSTTYLTPSNVPDYIRAIESYRPELMDGYPSAMLIMARVAQMSGLKLPRINAIISTAETLDANDKLELETAYQAQVFNQYSSSESTCFWSTCEHGYMHINPEFGITEIVDQDNNAVKPGQVGEVVTTSFMNPIMPLIRYRLGDLAIPEAPTPCPCGRHMPRIREVLGRKDDILFTPERGYLGRLDPVFKGLGHILEAQIVQESFEKLIVLIVPASGFSKRDLDQLKLNLQSKIGSKTAIETQFVEKIPRGANGKFRSVISQVKHLYPHALAS